MNKKLINEELNRIKEIMGVKLIKEAYDPVKVIIGLEKFIEKNGAKAIDRATLEAAEKALERGSSDVFSSSSTALNKLENISNLAADDQILVIRALSREEISSILKALEVATESSPKIFEEFTDAVIKKALGGGESDLYRSLQQVYEMRGSNGVKEWATNQGVLNKDTEAFFEKWKPVITGNLITPEIRTFEEKMQRFSNRMNSKNVKGYIPTEKDYLFFKNKMRSLMPEINESELNTIINQIKKLKKSTSYQEFMNNGGDIIVKQLDRLQNGERIRTQSWIEKKGLGLWEWIKENPTKSILGLIILAPTTAGLISKKVGSSLCTFLKTIGLNICAIFASENDKDDNDDDKFTNDLDGFLKWVKKNGYTEGAKEDDKYIYKDKSGEWQMATYSDNTWK